MTLQSAPVFSRAAARGGNVSEGARVRTREEVLKDFRTDAILAAARQVMSEVGYAEASMERIAQAAGVAKGTLYLYFESKEMLLAQAFEQDRAALVERSRQAASTADDAVGQLKAIVRASIEHAREQHAFFQAVVDARVRPSAQAVARDAHGAYLEFVAEIVSAGIARGALRPVDPVRAARQLLFSVSALVAERLLRGEPLPADEDVEALLDLYLHGVAVAERGR